MADPPSGSDLAEALSAAGAAHHEYEQTALKGVRDELWAGVYAAFVLGPLPTLDPDQCDGSCRSRSAGGPDGLRHGHGCIPISGSLITRVPQITIVTSADH